MQKNEIAEIVKAINDSTGKTESSKILDTVIKFISTASFALVMWVLSTVNAMQKDMVGLSSDAAYMRNSLAKMEAFSSEPRFTQANYDTQTLPILNALTTLTEAIDQMEKRLNNSDLERQKLLISIQALEKKK